MTPEQIEQMICIVGGKKLNEKIFGPPPPQKPSCYEIGCFLFMVLWIAISVGFMMMVGR